MTRTILSGEGASGYHSIKERLLKKLHVINCHSAIAIAIEDFKMKPESAQTLWMLLLLLTSI